MRGRQFLTSGAARIALDALHQRKPRMIVTHVHVILATPKLKAIRFDPL